MKLFRKIKKGFTLVELVVVIAVIAILAAVSVVSYIGVTNNAKKSNDTQVLQQVNNALILRESLEGEKPQTMSQALDYLNEDIGVADIEKLLKTTYKKYQFAYDLQANRFVILEGSKIAEAHADYSLTSTEGIEYRFWKFTTNVEPTDKYSHYLNSGYVGNIVTCSGVDVGENLVNSITYNHGETKADVVFNTNNGTLTINALNGASADTTDKVSHYGYAAELVGTELGSFSYHEYGIIKKATVESGHFVAEDNSEVFYLKNNDEDTPATIESQAVVHNVDTTGTGEITNNSSTTPTEVTDATITCSKHTYGDDYMIGEDYYHMCTNCGHVEKHAYDEWDGSIPEERPESLIYNKAGKAVIVNDVRAFAYLNKLESNGTSVVRGEVLEMCDNSWDTEYWVIVLNADINFLNHTWKQMLLPFSISGNNHTLKNIIVDGAGMFSQKENGDTGYGFIKNLVIDNITVNSTGCAGAIMGWSNIPMDNITIKNSSITGAGDSVGGITGTQYGSITNSKVINTTITGAKKKVGSISAWLAGANSVISNCVAENNVLSCGEEKEMGGITGRFYLQINGTSKEVVLELTDCTVKNCSFKVCGEDFVPTYNVGHSEKVGYVVGRTYESDDPEGNDETYTFDQTSSGQTAHCTISGNTVIK